MRWFGLETKCPCGCDETNFKIYLFGILFWYFTDCGEWWLRFGTWKTVYSYSKCQGFIKYDRNKLDD
jgi:hypothetical protein